MNKITSLYDLFSKESQHESKQGYFFVYSVKSRKSNEQKRNHVLVVTDGKYAVKTFLKDGAVDKFRELNDLRKGAYIYADQVDAVIIADRRKFSMAIANYEVIDYDADLPDNIMMLEEKFDELKRISNISSYYPDGVDYSENPSTKREVSKEPSQSESSKMQNTLTHEPKRKNPVDRSLMAIELLSSYQNNWAIKARVSYKSDIKTWSNQKGSGSLFNVHFLDETGEIRATAFNDACTKFSEMLQEGKVYRVSKARLKAANHKFSTLKHSYEIQLENDTQIEECVGDEQQGNVPQVQYEFVKIKDLKTREVIPGNQLGGEIDVVGIIQKIDTPFQITSKAGKTYDRRNITIVDDSLTAISVNLWGRSALDFSTPVGSVIVCKGCKLNEFRGKNLSIPPSGRIIASPDITECYKLKGWYDDNGKNSTFENISEENSVSSASTSQEDVDISKRVTSNKLINEQIGMGEESEYVTIKGYIGKIKNTNVYYEACITPNCLKKVMNINDTYECDKCGKVNDKCLKRYTLNMNVIDAYDSFWVSCFSDVAEKLIGHTADELADDQALLESVFNEKSMDCYNFRVRANKSEYGGVERARYTVVGINPINYNKEVDYLSDMLLKL